ncbi:hypothetical protein BKA60DRAFT_679656 [Fusarium oxysporum]|uniref:Uncharacterized protein n=1 Tax=Fusarium oxysporum TaxID=5507 RepID=A0A420MS05_FUSOX|nr:hypothetical protein BKA60DRAFT_679656 [Fusarium oxysporum]RKK70806.1 hypothetical protein BFJ69_g11510 [Fusarium oxysporum]
MIRQKWLPNARALFAAQKRCLSSPSARFPNFAENDESWGTLQEKLNSSLPNAGANSKPVPGTSLKGAMAQDHGSRYMLVMEGLPTSLRAADFHRLAPGTLSGWENFITNVHQERDPWTMEPLGTYYITFPSSGAAYIYRDRVERLLRLAQAKMKDKTGLWVTKVNPVLINKKTNPAVEVERFTLLPGSYPSKPEIKSKRVRKMAWQKVMDRIVEKSSIKRNPSHVLLELPQASFTASELKAIIKQDGIESGHNWQIDVFSLRETMNFDRGVTTDTLRVPLTRGSPEFRRKLDSRFVLTCATPEVAWRFIRNWNQRILEYDGGDEVIQRNRVKASYIET